MKNDAKRYFFYFSERRNHTKAQRKERWMLEERASEVN